MLMGAPPLLVRRAVNVSCARRPMATDSMTHLLGAFKRKIYTPPPTFPAVYFPARLYLAISIETPGRRVFFWMRDFARRPLPAGLAIIVVTNAKIPCPLDP